MSRDRVHSKRIDSHGRAKPWVPHRRGVTLVESLIAAMLLVVVVTAVLGALSAGQQHATEARRLVSAGLSAEMLMARVTASDWSDLDQWNGYQEQPGKAMGPDETPLPELYNLIGRRVTIIPDDQVIDELQVIVSGYLVTVESYDAKGRVLASIIRFIPEPQA